MKKTIAIILSILIILNLYSPNLLAVEDESFSQVQQGQTQENFNSMMESGTVETHGEESGPAKLNTNPSFLEFVTLILGNIAALLPGVANNILAMIVYGNTSQVFTIQNLLTNKYGIFDINFFRMQDENVRYSDISNGIKNSVAVWYYSIRNITLVGIAIIAVYIGIRMAISVVADKKAKYKKMLIFWMEALALVFLLQYLIVILLNVSETIVSFMIKVMDNMGETGVEESIIQSSFDTISGAQGAANKLISVILYFMLVYYELKFFIIYISRVFRVAFYMVISPLVCLTYPLDKVGDGRAQAFKNWIIEYTMEIFLQPIHLGLYIVFLFSAGEIIKTTPFLGIAFLAAIGNGEKIVRKLLNVKPKFAKGIKEQKLPGQ